MKTGSGRLGLDIAAGRGLDGPVLALAVALGRSDLLARVRLQPGGPIGPPAAGMFLGTLQPFVVGLGQLVVGPVGPLVLGGWIDHAGDMAGGAHDEALLAGQMLRGSVGSRDRND